MRSLGTILVLAACLGLLGCSGHTTPGGGTEGTPGKNITGGPDENSFLVKPEHDSLSIKPDTSQMIKVKVDRGSKFHQDVDVTLEPPEGIKVEPKSHLYKDKEPDTSEFKVSVDKGVKDGDYKISIKGKPKEGSEAGSTLTIKVKS